MPEDTTDELEFKHLELLENHDKIFGDIEEKQCGNCIKFPNCGMLRFLNNRIDHVNIYNGTVGTDKEIPHYGESWVCGTHVWTEVKEEAEEIV